MSTEQLARKLVEANDAYFNLGEPIMTDRQYDSLKEELRKRDPDHALLSVTGAPINSGKEVKLPYYLPSCMKTAEMSLHRFLANHKEFVMTPKYDGVSALWIPDERKLYTRGDGIKGQDISRFVSYISGLKKVQYAVRGELMLRKNSKIIPEEKIGRNIITGLLNRDVISSDHREIRFIAYEIVDPPDVKPKHAMQQLVKDGFETAAYEVVKEIDEEYLENEMELLVSDEFEYDVDGIVLQSNKARPQDFKHEIRQSGIACPKDVLAWKPKLVGVQTTVTAVKWQISSHGLAKPVIVFNPVKISGAIITQASGHNAKNIVQNGFGPGAVIEVVRAGRTIPYIDKVIRSVDPDFPPGYFALDKGNGGPETENEDEVTLEWVGAQGEYVDIKVIDENTPEIRKDKIRKALEALNTDNVGPSAIDLIFNKYCVKNNPLTDLETIYNLSTDDFARLDGFREKKSLQVYNGLRNGVTGWTELDLLVASHAFPRGVAKSKLGLIMGAVPNTDDWNEKELLRNRPAGVSNDTLKLVAKAMTKYNQWKSLNPNLISMISKAPKTTSTESSGLIVVLSGTRDKELKDLLIARGHLIKDTVTKIVTHVISTGEETTKTKLAEKYNIPVITIEQAKKL